MAVSSLAAFDESPLVAQAREGDATAFNELVRRYEGKIFRLSQHITQNREDAEDVLQETFLKAYEHLDQFKGDSKFYTWIVRIAVNQALMKLRRRKTDKSVSLDETIDTGEDTVTREDCGLGRRTRNSAFSREELGEYSGYRNQAWSRSTGRSSYCATSRSFRRRKRPKPSAFPFPAVKSRLLRARLQLREKLTRFFKRKGDDAFAYM